MTVPDEISSPGLAARREAVEIVRAVVHRHRFLDEEFDASARHGNLKSLPLRDRRLSYAITAATLRRHGELKHHLGKFLAKPLPKSSGPAFEILLVAAVQILFMRIPAHAAADIAVALAKSDERARHFAGLINAVCRNLSAAADKLVSEETEVSLNTPPWLFRKWSQHFGEKQAFAIALAHSKEAPLDLTVRGNAEEWARRLGGEVYWGRTIRLQEWPQNIADMPGYIEGEWWVQDAASALPVNMLGNVQGKRILDLCAAPGGKTAQLAAAGAQVTALDRSAERLKVLEENLARLRLRAEIKEHDMTTLKADPSYDAVLLDAPCSATGTIRRHPDLIFHLSPQRIAALAESQLRMIRKAASFVRPGGILLYSTCSLEPEEGESHLLDLPESLDYLPFSARDFAFESHWVDRRGFLKTTPDQGLDGFFAMRLKKV